MDKRGIDSTYVCKSADIRGVRNTRTCQTAYPTVSVDAMDGGMYSRDRNRPTIHASEASICADMST
jgi:hypothetical protein